MVLMPGVYMESAFFENLDWTIGGLFGFFTTTQLPVGPSYPQEMLNESILLGVSSV